MTGSRLKRAHVFERDESFAYGDGLLMSILKLY
jgi:hypothetical protein